MIGLSHDYDDDICSCPKGASLIIETFKVSDTRVDLRCKRCNGLVGWWDDDANPSAQHNNNNNNNKPPKKKLTPPHRDWSLSEAESMR